MESSEAIEAKTGFCISIACCCVFFVYSMILENLVTMPQVIIENKSSVKFINMIMSCTHASIAACWSLYCLCTVDGFFSDIMYHSPVPCYILCCFSIGYFLHDALHTARHVKYPKSRELYLHHIAVGGAFGTIIYSHRYVNFSTLGLVAELNSVFLHARTMLLMLGYSKSSGLYKFNGILNVLSFIFSRICILFWMCRWMLLHFHGSAQPYHTILTVLLSALTIINVFLFYTVLVKDNWFKLSFTSFSKLFISDEYKKD